MTSQNSIVRSIRLNLAGLVNFTGRQSRAQFWPYAMITFTTGMILSMIGIIGPARESFDKMLKYAEAHPEQSTIIREPGHISISIDGPAPSFMDVGEMMTGMAPGAIFIVIMLAAAVARRLHDHNKTGLIGLLPIAFLGVAGWQMTKVFGRAGLQEIDISAFALGFAFNFAYMASLGLLIVLLCLSGTAGDNKYGALPSW